MRFDFRSVLMGLAFALMWSSAFSSARIIVTAAPPLSALSLRFLISGLLGIVIAAALGQKISLTKGQWVSVLVFGISQNALYLGLNFVAMQWISAGLAAVIASTMPLIVALLGRAVFGDRLTWVAIAGLLVGLGGVALIMETRISGGVSGIGVALCALAALALSVATLTVRAASGGGNLMMVVGLQMLVGSAALAPVAIATETLTIHWSWALAAAFAYTTLVPGLAATSVWFALVGRIGPVRASTFHFLNPFFGVAIAAALLGEPLSRMDLIGVTIITLGILAVQLAKQRATIS